MRYGAESMIGQLNQVLIKHPEDAFLSQTHLDLYAEAYGYIGIPDYKRVLSEFSLFEDILTAENIEMLYLPVDRTVGLDSIYAHDSLKITAKGAIYFPMGKALRANESTATRSYLEGIGIPTLGVIESPARIEGGDVLWLDGQTVAIGRGYRTNDAGIEAFKALTRDFIKDYIIVPMPHAEGEDACLHLMSIISMIDQDLAVVYSKYMPVFFREYLINRGIKLIETSDQEYDHLGSNVLALGPRVVVMLEGNPGVQSALEENGVKVYTYPGDEVSLKGTGGPTCLTCPLHRG